MIVIHVDNNINKEQEEQPKQSKYIDNINKEQEEQPKQSKYMKKYIENVNEEQRLTYKLDYINGLRSIFESVDDYLIDNKYEDINNEIETMRRKIKRIFMHENYSRIRIIEKIPLSKRTFDQKYNYYISYYYIGSDCDHDYKYWCDNYYTKTEYIEYIESIDKLKNDKRKKKIF